jgi:hypothetical protein
VLSDHEQRALEEIERRYEADAPQRSATRSRPPGWRALTVLGGISVAVLVLGAPAAALALATAGAICWCSWYLWRERAHGGTVGPLLMPGAGRSGRRSARRPGESVWRYLRWMSEAE